MSYRILGVGAGVFIVIAIWITALTLSVVFSKAKRPVSFLGSGSIALALLVTIILLCIPRGSPVEDPVVELLPSDYLFIWRLTLLVFLFVAFVAGIIFVITEHWSVSMPAKPLRKVARKTVICENK
ncbi:hypothetical protein JTE90_003872 [Oedothorax gibbosus]|uniref:Transmembrane protein 218 n=1 Tax=Oedothorax gibbosus TaxID=931172 RepID=A0AAV6UGT8_9ARAC|nr:hypothetical protein JTE90_003872 [Oedothorax gibbosus]